MPQSQVVSDRVVLFLHIPKTAGATLMNIISCQYASGEPIERSGKDPVITVYDGSYWPPFDIYDTCYPPFSSSPLPDDRLYKASHIFSSQRDAIRAALGHFPFGLHEFLHKPFTYVTMLREPVDRVISLYYYTLRYSNISLHNKLVECGITLEQFVAEIACNEADNDQTRRLSGINPDFGDCNQEMLEIAKNNVRNHFSAIGVMERFDESLVLMKRVLNWQKELRYEPTNMNDERPGRGELPSGTRELIARHNALDIQLYNFAVEMLDEQISTEGPGFAKDLEAFKFHQSLDLGAGAS